MTYGVRGDEPPEMLVVSHMPFPQLEMIAPAVAAGGMGLRRIDASLPTVARPRAGQVAGIICLGGQQSVLDLEREPFLRWELELVRDAVRDGTPVLGLCLGAQLLALATDGRVERLAEPVVGWKSLRRQPAIDDDALFGSLAPQTHVLEWHDDAIIPGPDAVHLAQTDVPACSVFRAGAAAWGSQMHLEMGPAFLGALLEDATERANITAAGHTLEGFRREALRRLPSQMELGHTVLQRFVDLVARRARLALV